MNPVFNQDRIFVFQRIIVFYITTLLSQKIITAFMKKFSLYLFLVFMSFSAYSQNYTILGNASSVTGCNCYRLTPDANDQAGAIFQNQTLDLNNSFDFTFNVFLGCNNGNDAADGIVFVLTNNPNGLGSGGGLIKDMAEITSLFL